MAKGWRWNLRNGFGDLKVISVEDRLTLNLRIIMNDMCTWEMVLVETVVWTSNYFVHRNSTEFQKNWILGSPHHVLGSPHHEISWCGLPSINKKGEEINTVQIPHHEILWCGRPMCGYSW